MTQTTPGILAVAIRALSGADARRKPRAKLISRDQVAEILRQWHAAGGDLVNDGLLDSDPTPRRAVGYDDDDETPEQALERAVAAWADLVRGIKCVSVSSPAGDHADHGEAQRWHGSIRFDDPGQMHPFHHCDVMFAPASLEADSIDYLRGKCELLLRVRQVG